MDRSSSSSWVEAYQDARRAKLDTAAKVFADRLGGNSPSSSTSGGEGAERRHEFVKHVCFLRELVKCKYDLLDWAFHGENDPVRRPLTETLSSLGAQARSWCTTVRCPRTGRPR
jgi:hypothetical protein